MNKTREQVAGYLYTLTCQAIQSSGTAGSMLAGHIVDVNEGTQDFKGSLWQRRELEPDGRIVELDSFEDYLLLPEREGLGLQSLMMVEGIVRCHDNPKESAQAMEYLEKLIPNFKKTVEAQKAKLAVERVEPAKSSGGANNPQGVNQHNKNTDKEVGQVDNVHLTKPLNQTNSNSQARIIAKLKREQTKEDIPDVRRKLATSLLNQMAAGEMSARSAAITMGWKKPVDPMAQVQKYLDALSATDKIGLWEELGRSLPDGFDYLSAAKEAAMNLEADEIAQFKAWIATEL